MARCVKKCVNPQADCCGLSLYGMMSGYRLQMLTNDCYSCLGRPHGFLRRFDCDGGLGPQRILGTSHDSPKIQNSKFKIRLGSQRILGTSHG